MNPFEGQRKYDVVAIGTSPAVLLESIWQCRQGNRVAILDRRLEFGGAWFTRSLWNYSGLEVGCHYIGNNRRVYEFLEQLTGSRLVPMKIDRLYAAASSNSREPIEDGSPSAYPEGAGQAKTSKTDGATVPDRLLYALYGRSLIPLRSGCFSIRCSPRLVREIFDASQR